MHIEDQMAPIKRGEIQMITSSSSSGANELMDPREQMATRLLGYLNEKRDSYNGVISSIIYMIDSADRQLLDLLESKLRDHIIVEPMRYGGKIFITRCLPRLINERPDFVGRFFATFLLTTLPWSEANLRSLKDVVRTQIIALKAIHQVEQKTGIRVAGVTDGVVDAICDDAMIHGDETTKIDTLYILLDTKSATKVLGCRELSIFQRLFGETLNFQVPALRQKFLAISNKLIKRIRDSIRVVQRDSARFVPEDQEAITTRYMRFLEWLINFCLDNIYCNKYFGSFIITMTTLSYIIEHITLNNKNLPIANLLQNRRFYDSILSCLALDSFEDNKKMALKLLFALPKSDQYINENSLVLFESIAYELVNSVNPAHSMTCQYIFKLLIGIRQEHSETKRNVLVLEHLDQLVSLVEDGIREAREDFISAMRNNAIYPKLTCIRALLDEVQIENLDEHRGKWDLLTQRMVKACVESSQVVSSIVCNMNPETIGHLPMDLKPIDASLFNVGTGSTQTIPVGTINTITSQHLLITGWKTIKECSLSVGAMCSIFWWPTQCKGSSAAAEPILKNDQIEEIINFFEHYLRNLRHRGAFEQAYNGFIMVTKRIWLDPKLKELLLRNLNSIMRDFESGQEELDDNKVDYLKKHVTRRSAGLPFLILGILVAEDRNESQTLCSIMDSLVAVSNCPKAAAYQKIHCLNILKALMNDFNLGEKVTPYIGQVLLITIDAFGSDNFSIRNCANMLMRAIVDRTFGVSRLRDEIHKRNTLSYEKFFTDYPDLHAKFRTYLTDGLRDRRFLASVHAVFIVLSRLRPSLNPSEDFTVAKIVEPFIAPTLELALSCPDFKLRELAAKLLVQLETHSMDVNEGLPYQRSMLLDRRMAEFIRDAEKGWHLIDRNVFHGNVCVLKSWVERHIKAVRDGTAHHVSEYVQRFISSGTKHLCGCEDELVLGAHHVTLWSLTLDLLERFSLVQHQDPTIAEALFHLTEKLSSIITRITNEPHSISHPNTFGPALENLMLKTISLYLGVENSKPTISSEGLIRLIARRPDRVLSVNFQAALIRLLKQLIVGSGDAFIHKLMDNLDLDATAALMTPFDKLNQHSELDSQKELWVAYCEHLKSSMRSNNLVAEQLQPIFDLTQYEEFKHLQDKEMSALDLTLINSPRATELLAFVLGCWTQYNLEDTCIWPSQNKTMIGKLEFLIGALRLLPDCDIKCLVLLCASKYLTVIRNQITSTSSLSASTNSAMSESVANSTYAITQFTKILEDLADGQHDRMIRETCSEIIQGTLCEFLEQPIATLRDAQMNLLSTLIKLCQDEAYEIRQASSGVIAKLCSPIGASRSESSVNARKIEGRLDTLVTLMVTRKNFFDPNAQGDILHFTELVTRVIFHHSKASLIDVNEERESLFDKTKPNTFADHVATIHGTLVAASQFFKRTQGEAIDVESLRFSPEVVQELSSADIKDQSDYTIGDYSWRLINDLSLKPSTVELKESGVCNRQILDEALRTVKRCLNYFNHWNMLTDTSFGYHESSIFKRLAFCRLVMDCTNYRNDLLMEEIRSQLSETITTSCATTILFKSLELVSREI